MPGSTRVLESIEKTPVVLLCGGRGTRFREETESRPKPMVEIGGIPILLHIMRYYARFGFRRFILALGYKSDTIKNYFYTLRINSSDFTMSLNPEKPIRFHSHGSEHGLGGANDSDWEITCVDTGLETLKGGRIKRLEKFLDSDRFHLTYGDGLADVDLLALDQHHCKSGALGTVTAVRPPSRFGELDLEGDRVVSIVEKSQMGSGFINGGFFVFDRRFLSYLTDAEGCDLEFGPLQELAKAGQLGVNRHNGFWQCMDNARERDFLEELVRERRAPWLSPGLAKAK